MTTQNKANVRAIERDYFAMLGDKLTLDRWGKIIDRALADAENGDAKAREWVAKFALGAAPLSLFELAKRERMGIQSAHEIEASAQLVTEPSDAKILARLAGGESVEDRAYKLASAK